MISTTTVARFAWLFQAALAAMGIVRAEGSDQPKRPNILVIVSEDNGPELGCYGDPYVKTPILDQLAAGGVRFQNAYVAQAGCSQSRAALLTGLFPHQNGQIGLATWNFRMYREDTPNVVRALKQVGYRTGIIGKLHVNPSSAFPFDVNYGTSNFSRTKLGSYAAEAKQFFNASETPFFLSVNYPDAHRPFLHQVDGLPKSPLTASDVHPPAYIGLETPELREQSANYYNCLSRLDSLIGDLLAALRESGKFDDTLIVYLGDHGADLLRGKRTSYEGGVRIPLILHWKSRWNGEESGRTELVSAVDLMPTLLAAAGAEPAPSLPGRSLLPSLDGESVAWRRYLFTEFHTHSAHEYFPQRTVRDERYKLIQNLMPGEVNPGYDHTLDKYFSDVRAGIERAEEPVRSAYRLMQRPPVFELYDLHADPFEFRNLANIPEHQEALLRLKKELEHWRVETRDPLLHARNVIRLKQEIESCFVDGEADKDRLKLAYPDYFFQPQP